MLRLSLIWSLNSKINIDIDLKIMTIKQSNEGMRFR